MRDIASIILNLDQELDYAYLDRWAINLDLVETWREVQDRNAERRNL